MRDQLNKPYYLFRPYQLLSRFKRKFSRSERTSAFERAILPWGLPICVRPSDTIGSAIIRTGVYDLCVVEVLWRLIDKGEMAVDAGANIGQMTSVMAMRVANTGKVLSFEPHPQVFQELASNVALWQNVPNLGKIELHQIGLSKEAGIANLHTNAAFGLNRGTASLESNNDENADDMVTYPVSISRLTDVVANNCSVGVMKIDVEGHELDLLQGASFLLNERRIRDIVFEDHNLYPSPVTDYLEQLGYSIFSIQQGPLSVRVCPAKCNEERYKYEAQSYLATLDVPRALKRLSKIGYQSLRTCGGNGKSYLFPLLATNVILLLGVWILAKRDKQT